MAVGKGILTKINSIKNTQKITKAMQMVSTSKMKRAQDRMQEARPYAMLVRQVMARLAASENDSELPILRPAGGQIKRAGFVLITTDKGLCGSLNATTIKQCLLQIQRYRDQGIEVDVVCFGAKGLAACQRACLDVVAGVTGLGDAPQTERVIGALTELFDRYERGVLDVVHLVYSRFVNSMKQEPHIEVLLPIGQCAMQATDVQDLHSYTYVYEPGPKEVLDRLVHRYLESVVYQALVENVASEHTARMIAMKAATDNAEEAKKKLQLAYNKSRQAAITTELSEIVAGASAV